MFREELAWLWHPSKNCVAMAEQTPGAGDDVGAAADYQGYWDEAGNWVDTSGYTYDESTGTYQYNGGEDAAEQGGWQDGAGDAAAAAASAVAAAVAAATSGSAGGEWVADGGGGDDDGDDTGLQQDESWYGGAIAGSEATPAASADADAANHEASTNAYSAPQDGSDFFVADSAWTGNDGEYNADGGYDDGDYDDGEAPDTSLQQEEDWYGSPIGGDAASRALGEVASGAETANEGEGDGGNDGGQSYDDMVADFVGCLATGAATYTEMEPDTTMVDVGLLTSWLEYFTTYPPPEERQDIVKLVAIGHVLLQLRQALVDNDYETLQAVVEEVCRAVCPPCTCYAAVVHVLTWLAWRAQASFVQPGEPGAAEIGAAIEMMENRIAIAELTAALSSGGASGAVGPDMDTSTISLQALDEAIDAVTEMGCQSTAAQSLLSAANLIRELRAALLGGYWESVQSVLEETGACVAPERDGLPNAMLTADTVCGWCTQNLRHCLTSPALKSSLLSQRSRSTWCPQSSSSRSRRCRRPRSCSPFRPTWQLLTSPRPWNRRSRLGASRSTRSDCATLRARCSMQGVRWVVRRWMQSRLRLPQAQSLTQTAYASCWGDWRASFMRAMWLQASWLCWQRPAKTRATPPLAAAVILAHRWMPATAVVWPRAVGT